MSRKGKYEVIGGSFIDPMLCLAVDKLPKGFAWNTRSSSMAMLPSAFAPKSALSSGRETKRNFSSRFSEVCRALEALPAETVTAEGGRVAVTLAQRGSWVELWIADNGIGIKRDFLPFVFEPFRQSETHTGKAHAGLGLGLAIVRQLIHAHGGTVAAESPGENLGATFKVRLPVSVLKPGNDAKDASRSTYAMEPVLSGRKMLVMDDDPDACEMIRQLLARAGAVVSIATSADEALMKFRRDRPDAILSDTGMPYFDGYQMITKIRSLPVKDGGSTPAIAVTALGGEKLGPNLMAAGFQAHVPKPVDPPVLIKLVSDLLRSFSQDS